MSEVVDLQLFDPSLLDPGRLAVGLPELVAYSAQQAAVSNLITQPKHSTYDSANDREVIFNSEELTWTDWRGGMCWTLTAEDVAAAGARAYLDRLGVAPKRFGVEVAQMANKAANRYKESQQRFAVVHNG